MFYYLGTLFSGLTVPMRFDSFDSVCVNFFVSTVGLFSEIMFSCLSSCCKSAGLNSAAALNVC